MDPLEQNRIFESVNQLLKTNPEEINDDFNIFSFFSYIDNLNLNKEINLNILFSELLSGIDNSEDNFKTEIFNLLTQGKFDSSIPMNNNQKILLEIIDKLNRLCISLNTTLSGLNNTYEFVFHEQSGGSSEESEKEETIVMPVKTRGHSSGKGIIIYQQPEIKFPEPTCCERMTLIFSVFLQIILICILITIIYYILGPLIYDLKGKILEPIAILVDGLFMQINSSLPTCEQSQIDQSEIGVLTKYGNTLFKIDKTLLDSLGLFNTNKPIPICQFIDIW